jgi:SAM-dependent methyltransferase
LIRNERIIEEINTLWMPVYGYMAEHLLAVSGVSRGFFLDLGPFAGGLALNVLARAPQIHAWVIDESDSVPDWAKSRAGEVRGRLTARKGPLDPIPAPDAAFNLVAVRGAFFFLTPSLLREVRRVLQPGGFAWIGGGYGPSTPDDAIAPIAERSKLLNEAIGKRRVTEREAAALIAQAGLQDCTRIATAGGLWIEMRATDQRSEVRSGPKGAENLVRNTAKSVKPKSKCPSDL